MRRSIRVLTVLLATGAMLLAGCDDDGDTIITSFAVQGSFPGNAVADNNTAPDSAAFSQSDRDVEADDLDFWTNSQDRSMIVTWDEDGRLYASYTNGNGRFTPAVGLRGDRSFGNTPDDAVVIWLNTSGHSDATARSRHGDAIILFRQQEVDDPTNADSETTERLWSAYFDVSRAGQASTTATDSVTGRTLTFEWGFQKAALPVDDDPDDSDGGAGSADVGFASYGFVSDSHCGSYDEDGNSGDPTYYVDDGGSSGDPTTFAWALWVQDEDASSTTDGERYLTKQFGLTSADAFSFPTAAATALQAPADAELTDNVPVQWFGHDGSIFVDWGATGGSDDNDDVWVHYAFDASGVTSGPAFLNTDDNRTVNAAFDEMDLYGADHGLDFTLLFYTEVGFDGDPSNSDGDKQPDQDVYAATFDPSSGGLLGTPTEIDPFTTEVAGNEQLAPATDLRTRIARDGSWVAATFLQNDDNDSSDTDDNIGVKAVAYDTSRDLGAGTSPVSGTLELTDNMGNADEQDVPAYRFQVELAHGQTCDIRCAIQSNLDRMNVIFNQVSDGGTDPNEELHVSGLEVTLDTSTPSAPTLASSTPDTIVVQLDTSWFNDPNVGNRAVAYDSGQDGTANVVFAAQANNSAADSGSGSSFDEDRIFHFEAGSGIVDTDVVDDQISTDGTLDDQQVDPDEILVRTTPLSTGSGTHDGRFVHVFFEEDDTSSNDQLFHIAWDKSSASFGPLTQITHDFDDNVEDSDHSTHPVGVAGRRVGIYFQHGEHVWLNEWNPSSGWLSGGPALVDNHYHWAVVDNENDTEFVLDRDGTASSCDDLPSSLSAFSKEVDDDKNDERLLLRVHD